MEELLLHGWHNVVAGFGDRQERLVEIEHNKPLNQIPLRERLMERAISESDAAEFDAIDAKRQSERDAINAKWQPERDAFHARVCIPNCPWDGQTIFTHRKRDADGAWSDWCMRDEGEAVPLDERII